MKKILLLSIIAWSFSTCNVVAHSLVSNDDTCSGSFGQDRYEWQEGETEGKIHLGKNINYRTEFQASASNNLTPLWLNANKHGLSSLENRNGYVRGNIIRPLETDDSLRFGIGYGFDMAMAYNHNRTVILQQAYIETRWNHGVLTIGQKDVPAELKDNQLSSGSQTLGINARSVPQVRIALPKYWTIPGLNNWARVKGHIAYGLLTDESWQHDFTNMVSTYADNTLYHSKAGYLKIGKENHPFNVEMGLEMACLFGGTTHYVDATGKFGPHKENSGIKSFIHAFVPAGTDSSDGQYANIAGDHLGSWLLRLNYETPDWDLGVYADHFFEDHSQMFLVDFNGWGHGDEYNKVKKLRMFFHKIKDVMIGADLKLKNCKWANKFVVEYIYTKYQSGPINHDRTTNISEHYGGKDDYYNHFNYAGWQHWGQVIGNPLYRSPQYNTDGKIMVENNRFMAFHCGISGNPLNRLSYRLLATWQDGLGRYDNPFTNKQHNISLMAEATYNIPHNWFFTLACGMDKGELLGNNHGVQLTIAKTGVFGK